MEEDAESQWFWRCPSRKGRGEKTQLSTPRPSGRNLEQNRQLHPCASEVRSRLLESRVKTEKRLLQTPQHWNSYNYIFSQTLRNSFLMFNFGLMNSYSCFLCHVEFDNKLCCWKLVYMYAPKVFCCHPRAERNSVVPARVPGMVLVHGWTTPIPERWFQIAVLLQSHLFFYPLSLCKILSVQASLYSIGRPCMSPTDNLKKKKTNYFLEKLCFAEAFER